MAEKPSDPDRETDTSDDADAGQGRSGGTAAWMEALREVAPYLDLGWRLAGTAAFPPLIGYAVDVWAATTPWFLLAGCVLGLAGAVVQLKQLQENFGEDRG